MSRMVTPTPLKVVYIMGWGRSGSTILDQILGSVGGFFSTGELALIWGHGIRHGRNCGCGVPVPECPVWSTVLAPLLGELASEGITPADLIRFRHEALRIRHTRRILRGERPEALVRYVDVVGRLYRRIGEVTGAKVVVDSSKRPSEGAALGVVEGIAPYYIHLVRDPRAVAYSWQRLRSRRDEDEARAMPRHGVVPSTANWLLWNLLAEDVTKTCGRGRSTLVRYEDFVADPRATVERILRCVVGQADVAPFVDSHRVVLQTTHTAYGNPGRFDAGTVEIRADDEWKHCQRLSDRIMATAIALPFLAKYGYTVGASDA